MALVVSHGVVEIEVVVVDGGQERRVGAARSLRRRPTVAARLRAVFGRV
jgi:hypothetical protein